jgi:hypothetical protein
LSFEQAPPISVPLRFFLSAPIFGVLAGALLSWWGADVVTSRWLGETLALTHLLVAGFMLQAMTGALFQFLPVAAGCNIARPMQVAATVHPLLAVAALLLSLGLAGGIAIALRVAAALFLFAVAIVVVATGRALLRTPAQGATVLALRLALGGLAVTVLLGTALADGLAGHRSWPLVDLTSIHVAWGLGGWALMLLAGVAYFVVPMFQLTPPYPPRFARWLPLSLLAVLLAWSLQLIVPIPQPLVLICGMALAGAFSATTLWLQQRRRRRIRDPVFWFFRLAMSCLLAAALLGAGAALLPALHDEAGVAWILGVLLIPGVFVSAINGMLYKIVPFISWLHLQRLALPGTPVPNVLDLLPGSAMRGQMILHLLAMVLLLISAVWPSIVTLAGVAFATSSAWLGVNLSRTVWRYVRARDRIGASEPGR